MWLSDYVAQQVVDIVRRGGDRHDLQLKVAALIGQALYEQRVWSAEHSGFSARALLAAGEPSVLDDGRVAASRGATRPTETLILRGLLEIGPSFGLWLTDQNGEESPVGEIVAAHWQGHGDEGGSSFLGDSEIVVRRV